MANELKFTLLFTGSKGHSSYPPITLRNWYFDQTNEGHIHRNWIVGTAEENLDLGDLTQCRYLFFLMLATSASVWCDIGMSDSGTAKILMRLVGGATYPDFAIFPLKASTTVRAAASAAGTELIAYGLDA